MDLSPILISLKTAIIASILTFFLGVWLAYLVFMTKRKLCRVIADVILTLPMVLPPTVAGFFLLLVFGVKRPIGSFLIETIGLKIAFTWYGALLAAVLIALPLMYRSALSAFEQVNKDYLQAAQTLGLSKFKIFFKILLPLAFPGILSGGILAFTRAIGEFGATAMIAGNMPGITRTLPLAIYSNVASSDMDSAMSYVLILVAISFVAIAILNVCSFWQQKYQTKRDSL